MKNNTFISGRQMSGKSHMARQLSEGKNTIWYETFPVNNLRFDLNAGTELIVFDQISSVRQLEYIRQLSKQKSIKFRTPYETKQTVIKTPKIIAISNSISKEKAHKILAADFDYIEL